MIVALQTLVYFRETLLFALYRLVRPYYKRFSLLFNGNENETKEEEDDVFAEYDEEKGVVFFPPMYAQRYAAVTDCLMDQRWCGKLEKVVDLGYNDMSFMKYLQEIPGVKSILGVDLEATALRCSSDLFNTYDYKQQRECPLNITLLQGNAADPDYRLIGCDAVISIEMIEHMLPHDLERLVHTVFGFVKPWIAIFTTPNADFNVLFKSMEPNGFRRWDHLFEWSREQFNDWCSNIVLRYPDYTVTCRGIGPGPDGTQHLGCCSQMALFVCKNYRKQKELDINSLPLVTNVHIHTNFAVIADSPADYPLGDDRSIITKLNCTTLQVKKFSKTTQELISKNNTDTILHSQDVLNEIRRLTNMLNFDKTTLKCPMSGDGLWCNINWGDNAPYWNKFYKVIKEYKYPFETKTEESRILELITDEINNLVDVQGDHGFNSGVNKLEIPLDHLMSVVRHITDDVDKIRDLLEWNGYEIDGDVVIYARTIVDDICKDVEVDWTKTDTCSDVNT